MSEARQIDDSYEGPDRLRLKIPIGKSMVIRCVGSPIAFDAAAQGFELGKFEYGIQEKCRRSREGRRSSLRSKSTERVPTSCA